MDGWLQAAKAKREAEMLEKGGGKMEWIELDMTGKPLEEVIEYEVRCMCVIVCVCVVVDCGWVVGWALDRLVSPPPSGRLSID